MKICVESVPFFLTVKLHVALPEENILPQIFTDSHRSGDGNLWTADARPNVCRRFSCIGNPAITAEMALRFGLFFGMSAGIWMNLQEDYELRTARRERLAEFQRVVEPFRPAGV